MFKFGWEARKWTLEFRTPYRGSVRFLAGDAKKLLTIETPNAVQDYSFLAEAELV